jgi:hypothetical protein
MCRQFDLPSIATCGGRSAFIFSSQGGRSSRPRRSRTLLLSQPPTAPRVPVKGPTNWSCRNEEDSLRQASVRRGVTCRSCRFRVRRFRRLRPEARGTMLPSGVRRAAAARRATRALVAVAARLALAVAAARLALAVAAARLASAVTARRALAAAVRRAPAAAAARRVPATAAARAQSGLAISWQSPATRVLRHIARCELSTAATAGLSTRSVAALLLPGRILARAG